MKISVIMATLNVVRYIRQALESIAAQTLPVDELVVADGGSTDGSREIINSYPFARIIEQKGMGLPDAWNCAFEQCSGDVIAFLDGDDIWTQEKIAKQVALLSQEPDLDAVIGHVRFFLDTGASCPKNFKPELLQGTHPAHMPGALLVRRSAFHRIGLFDSRFPIACDIDWFARLRDLNVPMATLPHLLIYKRIHQSNLSLDPEYQSGYQRELARLLFEKRRRQAVRIQDGALSNKYKS
jgi:glycosyltransferase involved in cell wall biosynthesis